ncbi:amidohydrolase family protein [Diaminobutyricibacter sp. McL0618]|uniref:amidohydrolase family protein n=1 Tax=Leifsonia sp. McL0618 TaxID=3415677 RepID=UPI003CEB6727
MRAAETNTPPAFAVPAGACDTHFHIFEAGYPAVENPQYTFPDASLAKYLALTEVLGIGRMVIVQPTYYGDDDTLAMDVVGRLGDRARAVIRVRDDVDNATLESYDRRGARAIRLDLFQRRDRPVDETHAYIRQMARLARPLGWHLQFYAPGAVVHALLPRLGDLDVPFVVDHLGYLKRSDGFGDEGVQGILDALSAGNCWIKLSGAYRVAADEPMSTVTPLARALVDARPDRLIWGSDWPHLPDGQRDTGELMNLLAEWAPDPADRETILVHSPDVLFFGH